MHTVSLTLAAAWKVLYVGLILGAGLPALFALGVRSLALGTGGAAEITATGEPAQPHPAGKVLAGICFALVVLAAAVGLLFIVVSGQGRALSFEHVYPTIVSKH